MISFQPTGEQEMIRSTVRDFAAGELRELARGADEDSSLPAELLQKSWDLGLISAAIPAALGGGDLPRSPVTSVLCLEELGSGCASLGAAMMSPSLFVQPLMDFGTEGQKDEFLPLFTGSSFHSGSMALEEGRFGFDPARLSTTVALEDGRWILNGEKRFVPLGDRASHFLVVAGPGEGGLERLEALIVPRDTPGLEISDEPEKTIGFQSLPRVKLTLRNVKLPFQARLGGDRGIDGARLVNSIRLGSAALALGVSRAVTEFAIGYAKERTAFGEPIGKKQAIAFKLADMYTEVETMRWMVWKAASQLEQDSDATRSTTLARDYVNRKAMKIADEGIQILGGHGFIRDFPVEMWFRNTRALTLGEGPVAV